MVFKHQIIATLILFISVFQIACTEEPVEDTQAIPPVADLAEVPYRKLSEYHFFKGEISDLQAQEGVLPYDLNTPLFSDYAHKARFIYLPEGKQINYTALESLDFPVGTVLIKNFFYHNDERDPSKGKRIIETRLLIHQEDGWNAYPYLWNDGQTDADYWVGGFQTEVSWVDQNGEEQVINYQMPNKNDCKGCHVIDNILHPIGPKARNLNGNYPYADGSQNQLLKLKEMGWLNGMPALSEVDKAAKWDDTSELLEDRARAYLDVNCGHCHRPNAPANNSGLFLYHQETDDNNLGLCKVPVAAGSGSGGLKFDIVPGEPENSILPYRMNSTNIEVMMPELGRTVVHKEGVELIENWIRNMENRGCNAQ
ncbi:SO2930 family diheme c-type cytochrome [Limibacter armeniacum]|uniref:SO2930 family diheme c-type cytochrome n=1 Tax=Limibacter armeniacum TaxID=466084 RepID=UPI002FE645B8